MVVEKPNRKVNAAGLAGAISFLLWWPVDEFTAVDPPALVVSSTTVVVMYVIAYLVPERKRPPEEKS